MFLRNLWYVAAFSGDLAPGRHIARKILGVSVLLLRTQSGHIAALEDRCSHRAMPLSAGQVDGEIVRCFYHGIEFAADGSCARIPGQARIPPQAGLRSFPVVEKHQIVWIWMGDPALADEANILPNTEHDDPDWSWQHYSFHVKANWQLIVDNILDLTHLAYVHAGTIGGNAAVHFGADQRVDFDGHRVRLIRHMPSSIPPATYVKAAGFAGRVDRWQEVDFEPSLGMVLRVNAGATEVGAGAYEGRREGGFSLLNVHGITPETENTTHYIWSICTNAKPETGIPALLAEQFHRTIREDEAVLELQQQRIEETPDRRFLSTASDGATNLARRVLARLEMAERPAALPPNLEGGDPAMDHRTR